MTMNDDIQCVLMTEKEIDGVVSNLAAAINKDYKGKKLLLVGLLKGSIVFMSDLMRKITLPCEIDFMVVSSYGNSVRTSGNVKIIKDLTVDISGFDVLVVEDVVDSGYTLSSVMNLLKNRSPASLKLCALFDKPYKRVSEVNADYLGARLPDEFVVGYGLDYAEKYRNLPDLCILKPEIYN